MANWKNKGFKILPEFNIHDPIKGRVEVINMSEAKIRYDIVTPVEYEKDGEKKTFYQNIGTAFPIKDGGISLDLKALPVNGKIILFVHKDKKE